MSISDIPPASGNNTERPARQSENGDSFDIAFYFLDLNISDTSTFIQGCVSVHVYPNDPSAQLLTLDMANLLKSDSVRVNGNPVTFNHINNKLTVELPAERHAGLPWKIEVFYHGLGSNAGEVQGIYNKYNSTWDKRVTWTLSEPFSALNWFPCKQSLTDKADSVYVFLSTDKKLKAGSNGLLTRTVDLPGDRVRYEWKCRYPIAYYLISFAISDYMDYSFYVKEESRSDSLLIQNYIYNDDSYFAQNKASIDKTSELMHLYADLFGPYPYMLEKYGHCIAPAGGGMEHQTMTTLSNFSYLLVAHELAHQWFGDYVTCNTWQDIWINEGFASYSEYLAYQYLVSQSNADGWINGTHEIIKTSPGGSVFVPETLATDEDRIFDYRLTYAKGAAIIHMIRQEVGSDDMFFNVLREFLRRYKNGNASGMDFMHLLEEMTGLSFNRFFEQWYFGEGFPILSVSWNHRNDTLYIRSLQTTSSSTPHFNVLVEFEVRVNNRDTIISHRQDSSYEIWHTYLPGEVTRIRVDPRYWLLMHLTGINQSNNDFDNSRYLVIPNPAQDKITLLFSEPVDTYMVYLADSGGKILFTEESKMQRKTIDIKGFPKGMYFVIVDEKKVIYPVKFIKN
jgi:aminopeptidase N